MSKDLDEPARARAAAAMRRLGHALHSRDADAALLDRVADAADQVTAMLAEIPHRERDLELLRKQMWTDPIEDGEEIAHFAECFVSGAYNPFGIGVHVVRDGDGVRATVNLGPAYEGAPGRSHGGIVSAIFDDVLGCLLRVIGQAAFTGELRIRYLAPTPLAADVTFRARLVGVEGRKIDTEGEAVVVGDDGSEEVLATATARFIAIDSYV